MLAIQRNGYRGDGAGLAWPADSSGTHVAVRDIFGMRPFSAHVATEGWSNDFHRGVDFAILEGSPVYSPMAGSIIRQHYSHYGFEVDRHLDEFTLTPGSPAGLAVARSGSDLVLTCTRGGSVTLANTDRYQPTKASRRMCATSDDWCVEVAFSSAPSLSAGVIGVGVFNSAASSEHLTLEYNGTTFTVRAVGSAGAFTMDGATAAASSKTWVRVTYTLSTTKFELFYSTDGATWTSIASETGKTFTNGTTPVMIPTIYWESGDTSGTPFTINVDQFNWYDLSNGISRFGNWLEIGQTDHKVVIQHFQSFVAIGGQHVQAGQLLGYAGKTGFDALSGRVIAGHAHTEYHANNGSTYSNDDPVNILDKGYLQRTNVDNNVTVTGPTTANDPDGVSSWKLIISVARADQDFDLNSVSLTGNTTTRTVNWNTRAGLDPSVKPKSEDYPKYQGVYWVADAMDENSASYGITFYFNKSVVGSAFVSYVVKDTSDTTLASG